ncbi:MAG: DUF4147 domain-containing protein [Gemmataceae bacterium]|nr:DUF4147 domain-containing protein [Gemmataceae bacterium]
MSGVVREKQADMARSIWRAAVDAADPTRAVVESLRADSWPSELGSGRILVAGGGKAGAAMALGVELALAPWLDRIDGLVNVPEGSSAALRRIQLHFARPAGSNFPTAAGVAGAEKMLHLFATAQPEDVGLCLISGGGSALLPAPVEGVTLEDKLLTTKLLHRSGASIHEMNTVRKHLSRIKGGGLARVFTGQRLISLIVSDVVGDPLDVIASGPTAVDSTTFAEAIAVLRRFHLWQQVPPTVRTYLQAGVEGQRPETLKESLSQVEHRIIASNSRSLRAAQEQAERGGYAVLNLGAYIEGETREVAIACAGVVRSILREGVPLRPPCCLLLGGETTVRLGENPGRGGRNVEFVLAMLLHLGASVRGGITVLSAGTDGEDGPTDAAGAVAGLDVLHRAATLGIDPRDFLDRHDAYTFFERCGGLWKTGLTGTNVMDVRLVLID